jgi:hypothetical protein
MGVNIHVALAFVVYSVFGFVLYVTLFGFVFYVSLHAALTFIVYSVKLFMHIIIVCFSEKDTLSRTIEKLQGELSSLRVKCDEIKQEKTDLAQQVCLVLFFSVSFIYSFYDNITLLTK